MFPDLFSVHRLVELETRLKNAEHERRFAHLQTPIPSRVSPIAAAIRRIVDALGSLRPVRGQHLVEERARAAVAGCFEPASGRPC